MNMVPHRHARRPCRAGEATPAAGPPPALGRGIGAGVHDVEVVAACDLEWRQVLGRCVRAAARASRRCSDRAPPAPRGIGMCRGMLAFAAMRSLDAGAFSAAALASRHRDPCPAVCSRSRSTSERPARRAGTCRRSGCWCVHADVLAGAADGSPTACERVSTTPSLARPRVHPPTLARSLPRHGARPFTWSCCPRPWCPRRCPSTRWPGASKPSALGTRGPRASTTRVPSSGGPSTPRSTPRSRSIRPRQRWGGGLARSQSARRYRFARSWASTNVRRCSCPPPTPIPPPCSSRRPAGCLCSCHARTALWQRRRACCCRCVQAGCSTRPRTQRRSLRCCPGAGWSAWEGRRTTPGEVCTRC